MYPSTSHQIHYQGAGKVIGKVASFSHECSNLEEDLWAPFNSEQGLKLASWFIDRKVSKSRIDQYFSSALGDCNDPIKR